MAENKGYMTLSDEQGSIHISEEVIAAIAVGAVREVEGVSGMMGNLGTSVADLVTNKKGAQKNAKGVKIEMTETGLVLDIYLTVAYGHAIPEVAENAQKAVASAVSDMTGCTVENCLILSAATGLTAKDGSKVFGQHVFAGGLSAGQQQVFAAEQRRQRLLPHLFAVVGKGRGRDARAQCVRQGMGSAVLLDCFQQSGVYPFLLQSFKEIRHLYKHLDFAGCLAQTGCSALS